MTYLVVFPFRFSFVDVLFLMGDERYSERVLGVCMMDTMIDGMNSARKKKRRGKKGLWSMAFGIRKGTMQRAIHICIRLPVKRMFF